jgi:signal transduction histidine kinase
MLKLLDNERFKLSFAATHVFLSFIIVSSLVHFVATQEYFNNPIVYAINLINFSFSSIVVGVLFRQKWKYRVKQSSIIWLIAFWLKLLVIPMFGMVLSGYGLAFVGNFFFSVILLMMLVDKRSVFYSLVTSILFNFVLIETLFHYSSSETLNKYSECLQNTTPLVISLIKVIGILSLMYYKQIEIEIKADSMKTFSNIIAYEVFTPLAVIETTIGLLNSKIAEKDKEKIIRKLIKTCRTARYDVDFLLQNIKTLGSTYALNNTKHSLQQIVEECFREMDESFERPPKISFVVHNDIVFIGCDRMIKCVVLNILKNAFQHSGKDVSVDVVISGQNLIFQDNGCGIKNSEIGKIFNPFVSSKNHNLGIGLSISKEIITNHGGEIQCMSLEGNHTTLIIKFPKV